MADSATNTTYPGALDLLPEINANDRQNDPGLEHDEVHDRANALLNALQQLMGLEADGADSPSILGRLVALEGHEGADGDVSGPDASLPDRIAVFADATGKILKDGGVTISQLRALALTTPENVQTDSSYTLVLADAFKLVAMNSAAANVLTVPANAAVAFPVGTRIDLSQDGAGQTTVAAGLGVTVRSRRTLKLDGQLSKATLIKRDANLWDVVGELEAVP